MNNNLIIFALLQIGCWIVLGYTPQETNAVVVAALDRVAYHASIDTEEDMSDQANTGAHFDTWGGFLGGDETNGWSFVEKKQAFDCYLAGLGKRNLKKTDNPIECAYVLTAIEQCRLLNYTNSVGYLKGLVLNSNGVHRVDAIEVVLDFSALDDATISFVENIVTNAIGYDSQERCCAYAECAKKIILLQQQNATVSRGAMLLHRNRFMDVGISYGCDAAMTVAIPDYSYSSNRLEYAEWALRNTTVALGNVSNYFTSITNQLLSSGQPLRWINVGGTSE